MNTISARQLIYSRVEAKYSPVGRGGFQTVYASKELSRHSIETIEGYVRVFDVSDPTIRRQQFFTVDEDQVVVAQSQTLTDNREILDSTGGGGVFLAHCLVFSGQDFARIEANPFWVFDQFTFLEDSVRMVTEYNQASGQEPPVAISTLNADPDCDPEWMKIAPKLIALYDQLSKAPPDARIQLIGNPQQINDCLRTLILFIHPDNRTRCGFDTHAVRLTPEATNIRLVGLPKEKSGYLATFDIGRKATYPPVANSGEGGLFGRWLNQANFNPDDLVHLNTFHELSRAFAERKWPKTEQLSDESCAEFIRAFPEAVRKGVQEALNRAISGEFAANFSDFFITHKKSKIYVTAVAASRKVDLSHCREELRAWVRQDVSNPLWNKKSLNDLRSIARDTQDPVLGFWTAGLAGEGKKTDKILETMNIEDYRVALALLQRPLSVRYFLHPRFSRLLGAALKDSYEQVPAEELSEVLELCIDSQLDFVLEALAPRVLNLDNRQLTQVEKQIKREQIIAPTFMKNVQERRKTLGPPQNFLDFLSRK